MINDENNTMAFLLKSRIAGRLQDGAQHKRNPMMIEVVWCEESFNVVCPWLQ